MDQEINPTIQVSAPKKEDSWLWLLAPIFLLLGIVATLIAVHFYPLTFEDLGIIKEKEVVAKDNGTDGVSKEKTLEEKYPGKVAYEYSYKGKDYVLMMDNPADLKSEITLSDFRLYAASGKCLEVHLDAKSDLVVCFDYVDTDQVQIKGGVYGDTLKRVSGNIVRNSYFGYHYLIEVSDIPDNEKDEEEFCKNIQEEFGCVAMHFHYGKEGALRSYIQHPAFTSGWMHEPLPEGEEQSPTDVAMKLADDMIASYKIEEVK